MIRSHSERHMSDAQADELLRLYSHFAMSVGGNEVDPSLFDEYMSRIRMAQNAEMEEHRLVDIQSREPDAALQPFPRALMDTLRRVCVHKTHLMNVDKKQCVICLDDFCEGDRVVQLPCGHIFCDGCITNWLNTRCHCPICRKVVDVPLDLALQQNRVVEVQPRCCSNGCRLLSSYWSTTPLLPLPNCGHVFHPPCLLRQRGAHADVESRITCGKCRTVSSMTPPHCVYVENHGYGCATHRY
eukprot:PhF_6_TR6890/c0_g1_i1/m.9969